MIFFKKYPEVDPKQSKENQESNSSNTKPNKDRLSNTLEEGYVILNEIQNSKCTEEQLQGPPKVNVKAKERSLHLNDGNIGDHPESTEILDKGE